MEATLDLFKDIGEPVPKWSYDILINGEPKWTAMAFSARGDKLRITMGATSREKPQQLQPDTELVLRIYHEVGVPDAFYTDVAYRIKKFVGVDTEVDSISNDFGMQSFVDLTYVYTYDGCTVTTTPVSQ